MIRTDGPWFKDEANRRLLLRGINLSGSTKVPCTPNGATHLRENFFDHRTVSFVGRPFPLAEADEHLSRLRRWGFNFLRFLVTWEAIEHAGPGSYDEAYLDYVVQVIRKAAQHGFDVFIDPHQDVWSRFTGGDGAPGWTLEAVGFDLTRLHETGTAFVHAMTAGEYPRMIWPTNYHKLAAATMFTLFFAGNDFAPNTLVDGVPVQEFLQGHYIHAIQQLAIRLKDEPNVIGYDSLNEPHRGFAGLHNLNSIHPPFDFGPSPTALQSFALGDGISQTVGVYEQGITGRRQVERRKLNPAGVRAWLPGRECIWRAHGVWDVDVNGQPYLLKPDYFTHVDGRKVDFPHDYLRPFANRYARAIRMVHPNAVLFLEGTLGDELPVWGPNDAENIVNATHWYDDITLYLKDYRSWFSVDVDTRRLVLGAGSVNKMHARQLGKIKEVSRTRLGDVPTLIGEFGTPMDMKHKRAYRTGDFSAQTQALDDSYRALEANLLNSTLWNYTPDNNNTHGDLWNEEDLSIFSRDQQKDPNDPDSGGRALPAAVRPYARKTSGDLLRMSFDLKKRVFEMAFRHDPQVSAPTEVFVPRLHYPNGCQVVVSDGEYSLDLEAQVLLYQPSAERGEHTLRLTPLG